MKIFSQSNERFLTGKNPCRIVGGEDEIHRDYLSHEEV
jgi:hypothetical protein